MVLQLRVQYAFLPDSIACLAMQDTVFLQVPVQVMNAVHTLVHVQTELHLHKQAELRMINVNHAILDIIC